MKILLFDKYGIKLEEKEISTTSIKYIEPFMFNARDIGLRIICIGSVSSMSTEYYTKILFL